MVVLQGARSRRGSAVGALLAAPVGRRPTARAWNPIVALRATGAASSAPTECAVAAQYAGLGNAICHGAFAPMPASTSTRLRKSSKISLEPLVVFQVRGVATAREDLELRPGDAAVQRPCARRVDLVELADRDECGDRDLFEPVGAVPLDQRAGAGELVWTPHGGVDRHRHVLCGSLQWLRPRRNPAEVAAVEQVHRRQIVRVVVLLARFVASHDRLRLCRELAAPGVHPGHAFAGAGRAGGQGQTAQVLAVVQRVLDGQERAPGLTEKMHPSQIERLANPLHLGGKAGDIPEREIVGLVGPP